MHKVAWKKAASAMRCAMKKERKRSHTGPIMTTEEVTRLIAVKGICAIVIIQHCPLVEVD